MNSTFQILESGGYLDDKFWVELKDGSVQDEEEEEAADEGPFKARVRSEKYASNLEKNSFRKIMSAQRPGV